MGTIAKVDINGTEHLIASTAYAVCNTQTGTAAKVATIQGNHVFTLIPGITVHVYFSSSNIAENPTLNINNTGAKPICKHGTTAAPLKFWQAGGVVTFTYSTDPVSTGCWIINNYKEYNTTQENSNWTATTGVTSILNKPVIPSTYSDVGAASVGHTHTYSDVGAASAAHTHTYSNVGAASAGHAHGSITSDGKITATGVTLANGDALVVTDSSASHVIKKTSIVFDGSTTTKALTQKGTWETFLQNYTETDPTVSEWAKAPSKPMYTYIEVGAASAAHTHTYSDVGAASAGHTHTAANVGAVPTSRTVNGKSLGSNVTLTAADVGALPTTTVIPAAQVNSDWNATTGVSSILNKPSIPAAQVNANWTATTGVTSILNKPTIPSTYSDVGAASAAHTHTYSQVGAASAAHTHTAANVGAVPTTRTVNGKSLNANITLTATDVGALPTTTVIPAAQVNSNWTATTGVSSILNKPAIPSTYSDVGAMSAGGVSVSRKVSTGINIADITINGTATSLYAPQAGESPIYSYTLDYGAAVDSTAVLSAYNAGGIILVKDNLAPTYPIATLQAFEGNSNAIDTLTFVCFNGSKKITYFWQSDQTSVDNGWRYWEESYKGISVFEYDRTYALTDLINAINRNELLYCHVSLNSTDGYDLPLIYYSTDENIFHFGGVRFNGVNYVLDWANWDGGWDDNGSYNLVIPKQTTWYGYCSTTASTAAKAVTVSNFTSSDFKAGAIIGILFTTANTAAIPTLNINSLGAKTIYIGGNSPNDTTNVLKWSAYTMIYFMYDGTYWSYISATAAATSEQPRGANTWYGTSSTADATAVKTATINNFVLTKGALITINFSTANAYNGLITLNINSTGEKNIYYKNAVTSSTNKPLWKANSCVTFVYSGSYYYIVNITPSPNDEIYYCGQVEFNTQDQNLRVVVGLDPQDLSDTTDIGSALESVWDNTRYCYAQARGTGATITSVTATIVTQLPLNTIEKSYGGYFVIQDGGIKVPSDGTYRISGSVYGRAHNVTESGATASSIYNANFGCYIKKGTSFADSTEILGNWWPHCGASGHCIGPIMYDLNANDIVYLAFRSRTAACNVSPSDRATYLLVEKMP